MAKGLKLKVAFNFSIPLIIALLHSYFAVVFMKVIGFDNKVPIFVVMVFIQSFIVFLQLSPIITLKNYQSLNLSQCLSNISYL